MKELFYVLGVLVWYTSAGLIITLIIFLLGWILSVDVPNTFLEIFIIVTAWGAIIDGLKFRYSFLKNDWENK